MLTSRFQEIQSKLERYLRTTAELQPKQLLFWLYRRGFGFAKPRHNRKAADADWASLGRVPGISRDCWDGEAFTFAGESLAWCGEWEPADAPSPLWSFNLHYFDWLRDPELSDEEGLKWIRHWIAHHRDGIGWHPYPSSLRIVNWLRFLHTRDLCDAEIEQSLYVQADTLARNLEWHLMANHLWANAKALLLVSHIFQGVRAMLWRRQAVALVKNALKTQFLPDGGHVERTPMYHAILTEDLLDLLALLPPRHRLRSSIEKMVSRALRFLVGVCHPDREFAYFADSAGGVAPAVSEIFAYAQRLGVKASFDTLHESFAAKESGFYRLCAGPWTVLSRVGKLGPDYQLGHAHADTGTIELSFGAQRLIVDTGCGYYVADEERERMRQSDAHNVVTIDGLDSSEVWSAHRVARRAYPMFVDAQLKGETPRLESSHNGYAHLPGHPVPLRQIKVSAEEVVVQDRVQGQGEHRIQGFWHFPQGFVQGLDVVGHTVSIKTADVSFSLVLEGLPAGTELQVNEVLWWPAFGRSEPAFRLHWEMEVPLPAMVTTTLRESDNRYE